MKRQTFHATLLLILIISSTAIEVRNTIQHHLSYINNNNHLLDEEDVQIKNDNSEKVQLTLSEIQEIKANLKEQLNFKDSPVFLEVNAFTPVNKDNFELEKHQEEITNILVKATEPLSELTSLFETNKEYDHDANTFDTTFIESERKYGYLKKAYKYTKQKTLAAAKYTKQKTLAAANYVYGAATDESSKKKRAYGSCVKTTTFTTCAGNEECKSDPSNPCKGLCQCNTDNINNCECVHTLEFPTSMSAALDDTRDMGKAMTVTGAGFAAVFGFVDGFLGGMLSDFNEPWKNDENCAQLKDDFSAGLKSIIHSFKHLLHTVKRTAKSILTSSESRKHILRAIKGVLRSFLNFLGSVAVGLWKCPATKMIAITLGIIGAAIAANVAFLAAGLVVVPLIIKWVGAIVGLYFSFHHLKHLIKSLSKNIGLLKRNKCSKDCKETIVEKSFGIAGCLTEVVLMGAIGDVLDFGLKNPSKVKAAASGSKTTGSNGKKFKVSWSNDMVHDIRVLKIAAVSAKHKTGTKLTKVFKNFKSGAKQASVNGAKSLPPTSNPKFGHVSHTDDYYKSTKRLGGVDNPIKDMDEAADLMKKNKFSCDAAENGPPGRNPILDDAKAKKDKLSAEEYKKELQGAKNNAESFHNGEYNTIVLDEPITLYRAGPDDRALGQFWTRTPPKNRFEVRYNAAVKTEWSNIDAVYKVEIPAGTKMFEGYVAAQGGKYVGQGKQIFISKPWDIPGLGKVEKIGKFRGAGKGFDYLPGAVRHLPTLQARGLAQRIQLDPRTGRAKKKSSDKRTENDSEINDAEIDKIMENACDAKKWYGLDANTYGTCVKITRGMSNQCAGGHIIHGFCSNGDRHTKCCIKKRCGKNGAGICTTRSKCVASSGDKQFLPGLCPGPHYVRCCI